MKSNDHIQIVSEKAKNRTKIGQKRWFPQPFRPAGWVWTYFDLVKIRFCLINIWLGQNRSEQILIEQNQFEQILIDKNLFKWILTWSKSVQTEPAGRRGWKNHLFWRVFARFLSCFFCFFTDSLNMKGIFKKNTDTKFRRSTGIPTANSTNKYQKYKSVELADQLYQGPKPYGRYRK